MRSNESTSGMDLNVLDPETLRIRRDDFGNPCLQTADRTWENVRPVRTHPLTAPERFIAFLAEGGREEIGMLEDAAALEAESRNALEAELELEYFQARVLAIHHVDSRYGVTTWDLETDRGRRTAQLKDRGDLRPLPGGRVILTDMHGVRFDVPDMDALDEKSRRLLEEQM